MSFTRVNTSFGNASVFKRENNVINFQDNVRNKEVRLVAPTQQTNVYVDGRWAGFPDTARYDITYEVTLEKWTRMSEIYIHLEGFIRTKGLVYAGYFIPHNMLLAPAFSIAQNFFDVEICINGVPVTTKIDWSVLPGFLNAVDKNMVAVWSRCGVPYQKLIQEGTTASSGRTTRFMATDVDFLNTATTFINVSTLSQKLLVPLSTFCNLFAQPYILPPGVKLKIKFNYQNCINFRSYANSPPGTTWTEAVGVDTTNFTDFYFVHQNQHLQLTYYEIASTLTNEFMSLWKKQPWICRYFETEILAFPSNNLRTLTAPLAVNQIYSQRIVVSQPINSCLMMFCAIPKAGHTGWDNFDLTLAGGTGYSAYSYPTFTQPFADGSRLKFYPIKIDYLRVYLEDNADPILDMGTGFTNADIIFHHLKNETKNFFRIDENQAPMLTADIYGYRAAPFYIPLHSEKYFNPNFGPLPKTASYMIQFAVSSIDGSVIPAGYEIFFYVVRQTTLQIDPTLATRTYDNPLEFNGTVVEDMSQN